MIKNTLFSIVVGCLLGWILFFKVGFNPADNTANVRTDTITVVDTIKVPVYEKWEKPKPVAVIGAGLDEKKIYTRKIIPDSLGTLEITDTVQNNQLLGYSVSGKLYSIERTKNIITTTSIPERNKLLVGAGMAYTPEFTSIFVNLQLVTKKGIGIGIGYDMINKIYYANLSKEIRLRRK